MICFMRDHSQMIFSKTGYKNLILNHTVFFLMENVVVGGFLPR